MKPDFEKMTKAELKTYVLAHREDDDAVRALFSRRNLNSPKYAAPRSPEDIETQTDILRRKLKGEL